eukprot:scaffold82255_cov77-Phaeocystis_antarctica.AAC.1
MRFTLHAPLHRSAALLLGRLGWLLLFALRPCPPAATAPALHAPRPRPRPRAAAAAPTPRLRAAAAAAAPPRSALCAL